MNNYETLITKLDDYITKLTVVRDLLRTAPKLNVDAEIIIKKITNIDIAALDKQLDNQ